MPEIKRTFSSSKMNKDVDERLVPAGEYRDAQNIEINTSEGSNVGTVQTLKGNTALTAILPNSHAACVGSIADHKNDKLYWLVCGWNDAGGDTIAAWVKKDYILEYNIDTGYYRYIVVDIHSVKATPSANVSSSNIIYIDDLGTSTINTTGVRTGMHYIGDSVTKDHNITVTDIEYSSSYSGSFKITLSDSITITTGDKVRFEAERLLDFHPDRLITGINIMDGMLFWTDNYSEPKKINIERCALGTGGVEYLKGGGIAGVNAGSPTTNVFYQLDNVNGYPTDDRTDHFHTRLVSSKDGFNLEVVTSSNLKRAEWLKKEHITVLRKAPVTPPYLEMSIDDDDRAGNTSSTPAFAFSNVNPVTGNSELLTPGDGPFTMYFPNLVDFREHDIIIFSSDENANQDTFVEHEVRIVITSHPQTLPANGPFGFKVVAINKTTPTSTLHWKCRLEKERPMFEFKFPRFAYRYKYKDGEYSTISPWSEIAFVGGAFNYAPIQGYNLGMTNRLRNLKITDYLVEDSLRGRDVIEIDILYKEENSPKIYTVDTIKQTDGGDKWPDKSISANVYKRGEYELETELIHALLSEEQLIRPWDAVPRKALAQEIVANRLVYGNYLQNYNISNGGVEIVPSMTVGYDFEYSDLAKLYKYPDSSSIDTSPPADPIKSVKSIRTYQVGVVYRDELGRETPVLTTDTSSVAIPKEQSIAANKLTAQMSSDIPDWATSWKFFVKETSNEYYNMSMDRWYNAEDGNVWISFPSAERNKIDEDTFLILKKQHDSDVPVGDKARYKAIAIENEAPEFIKQNQKLLGKVDPSNYSVIPSGGSAPSASNQIIQTTTAGFPFEDYTEFDVRTEEFNNSIATSGTPGVMEENVKEALFNGQVFIRFSASGVTSKYYNVASIKEAPGSTDFSTVTIDGIFGADVLFLAPDQTTSTIISGIVIEVVIRKTDNKPEFDGRFFVKIYKDLVLEKYILSQSIESNYKIVHATPSHYIKYTAMGHNNSEGTDSPYGPGTADYDQYLLRAIGSDESDYTWHQHMGLAAYDDDAGIRNKLGSNVVSWWNSSLRRKYAFQAWWRAYSETNSWFIDSAITANEHVWGVEGGGYISGSSMIGDSDSPIYSNIEDGWHGVFDASYLPSASNPSGLSGPGTGILLSWSGIYKTGDSRGSYALNENPETFDVGSDADEEQEETMRYLVAGKSFRFAQDPDKNVYHVRFVRRHTRRYNYDAEDEAFDRYENAANKRLTLSLVVEDKDGYGIGNANGNGSSYHPYDHTEEPESDAWGAVANTANRVTIEWVEPYDPFDDKPSSTNPAIWETEPKEDVGLDIYYEASQAYPANVVAETNEQYAKIGCIVTNESGIGNPSYEWTNTTPIKVQSWSAQTVTLDANVPEDVLQGQTISFTAPDGAISRLIVKEPVVGGTTQSITFYGSAIDAITNPYQMPHKQKFTLSYSNCYSFGNGVESNRIRDDFNQTYIRNGVKASTVLAKHYEEEHKATGMIHSGIYNSVSGINETNQFIAGKKITKDLNPRHGSIQVMKSRNTNMAVITEDKCFSVLADKDALFKADGSADLLSKSVVLGTATAYAGDYGTKNPESFAIDNFRSYFVDVARGQVCRLSMDGITPISSQGMHDWFADNLKPKTENDTITTIKKVMGSFDDRKSLYNVSITQRNEVPKKASGQGSIYSAPYNTIYTLSYSENSKGWVSFKDIGKLESALSINNDYYTFYTGELYKEHSNDTRNNFHGTQYTSSITAIFNDEPGSIKSFTSINYEGTQAKITKELTDGNYHNLKDFKGWYVGVDGFETNEQHGQVPEFIEKEGKWFNYLRGTTTSHENDASDLSVTSSNLDQQEFSVQGIGVPSSVSGSGDTRKYAFIVANNTSTTYNPDTEIDSNTDGAADGVWDSTAD